MYKGQLKSWNDKKGFGFIQSNGLSQDTFIHISTLKAMSRKPKQGDFIYFEIAKQANGKTRAVNCRIEGVIAKTSTKYTPRVHKNTSAPKSKKIVLLVIIAIGAFAYQRLDISPVSSPAQHPTTTPITELPSKANTQFTCDGRQHCSQMTSRAEADFFTRHCPNTKMDGNHDGVPCEQQEIY